MFTSSNDLIFLYVEFNGESEQNSKTKFAFTAAFKYTIAMVCVCVCVAQNEAVFQLTTATDVFFQAKFFRHCQMSMKRKKTNGKFSCFCFHCIINLGVFCRDQHLFRFIQFYTRRYSGNFLLIQFLFYNSIFFFWNFVTYSIYFFSIDIWSERLRTMHRQHVNCLILQELTLNNKLVAKIHTNVDTTKHCELNQLPARYLALNLSSNQKLLVTEYIYYFFT